MWIANFFKELKVWRTIRKVCKESQYLSRYTKIDQETLYYILDKIEKGGQE